LVWSETDQWYKPSEQGLEMARLATKVTPDNADIWRTVAMALWATRHYDHAVAAYTKATQLNPDAETYNELGVTLLNMARYAESLIALDRAIEIESSSGKINNRGFVLWRLGRKEEALLAFEQAIASDPENPSPHSNRAGILLDLGQFDQAETAALKATQLDPKYISPWLTAGYIALYQGQVDAATERFTAALDCRNNPPGRSLFGRAVNIALALSCTDQGDEAVDVLRRALPDRLPGDEPPLAILELLARCQAQLARFDEVRELIIGTTHV
jgi:tetratricopeptide (TPR) repeat protein